MMLQQELPRDYVIATGVQYSVRQFIEKAAGAAWDHHSLGRGGECDCPNRCSLLPSCGGGDAAW